MSQAALGPALPVLSGSWVAQPDLTAFTDGDLGPVSAKIAALTQALPNVAALNGAQLVTSLSSVLAGAASNLTVARSTLVISALELLVLAVAALFAVARLLTEQREAETALLSARGATWAQLTRLAAAEVIPLAALAAVAGGLAGRLAALLASAGPVGTAGRPAGGRTRDPARRARGRGRRRGHRCRLAADPGVRGEPDRRAGQPRQAGPGGGGGPGRR